MRRRITGAVELLVTFAACGLRQSVLAPTRDDAYLDVAMYAGGDAVSEVRPGTFGSDHAEVITSFSFMSCPPARVRRTRVFNYRDADFDGLRRSIHCARWGILADLDVNSAAGLFTIFYVLLFLTMCLWWS